MRILRVFRPLRVVNKIKSLKLVFQCVVYSLKRVLNIIIIVILILFMFAVIGVHLFKGKFQYCNDRSKLTRDECQGSYFVFAETTPQSYQVVPRVWRNYDFHFDNVGQAMLTSFSCGTGEGWPITNNNIKYSSTWYMCLLNGEIRWKKGISQDADVKNQSFFGFGQTADVSIVLDESEKRKQVELKNEDGRRDKHHLYFDGETVSGMVHVNLKNPGKKLEHQGVKIEFIGQIELFYDRGNHHEFTSLVKELVKPGDLTTNGSYKFEFVNVEKPYESYTGSNVRLRYFLKVTIVRRIADVTKELDIAVHTLSTYPDMNNSIKMEVGIEDCLHIEFEYNKSKYHLKDVIVGKIYFLLVRIKIRHMELAIIKREIAGTGPNTYTENDTIAKYEIMDGAPVRGESIPIRLFLSGYELTPTMKDINKKFSVRYFLNLVLVDEEERRYFKQQEIILWRKGDIAKRTTIAGLEAKFEKS